MEKKTKLALFDMDQTLLDSDFAWAEAFILIAKEIGFENADDFVDSFVSDLDNNININLFI